MTDAVLLQPAVGSIRQTRHFRHRESPLDIFTDSELRLRYRFGRDSIHYLVDLLKDDLCRTTQRNHPLSVITQILIFLRFVASGSFHQVIGDTFGVDKSTVLRVIHNVSSALVAKKDRFILWPVTEAEKRRIRNGFYRLGKFPQVIGCVDGTHVRIIAPQTDEATYVNRKNFHSINVQGICDDEGKFTNIVARWPGSTHDSHIFTSSMLCDYIEANHHGLEDGLILGDSGYPCRPFLMTPFLAPVNDSEKKFNKAQKSTRVTIERTFGQWKRRFHILHSEVRLCPERVCRLIVACAVLHNIAKDMREPMEDEPHQEDDSLLIPYQGAENGNSVRRHIVNTFFT